MSFFLFLHVGQHDSVGSYHLLSASKTQLARTGQQNIWASSQSFVEKGNLQFFPQGLPNLQQLLMIWSNGPICTTKTHLHCRSNDCSFTSVSSSPQSDNLGISCLPFYPLHYLQTLIQHNCLPSINVSPSC